MSNAAAFGVGVGIGFIAAVILAVWAVRGGFDRPRGRSRALVALVGLLVVPVGVAVAMPNFRAALLVVIGSSIGVALSQIVTLPMGHLRGRDRRQ